jgi:hypothetical protein
MKAPVREGQVVHYRKQQPAALLHSLLEGFTMRAANGGHAYVKAMI